MRIPCDGIDTRHTAKLELCAVLEAIADDLPRQVDRNACLWVGARLLPAIRSAQAYEERVLYPLFAGHSPLGHARSLKRLRSEHVEDEALAEEVTEALLQMGRGGTIANPEAVGFMLRAFFETMRRHVAFEREHMLPLVRAPL